MRISDWSSDVCSSDLCAAAARGIAARAAATAMIAKAEASMGRGEAFVIEPSSSFTRRCSGMFALNRSEEHTSELQSLMRISYAVFCLKKKNNKSHQTIK